MISPTLAPVSCDSLVALPAASACDRTLFAKNSDRPALECQRLVQFPQLTHQPGSLLKCQYISIPQVEHTFGLIGSQPHWLWGLEHGFNEFGVVIGNHTVFTKDPLPQEGLLGMDLVRLGLERSRTAPEAVEAMTDLLERFGQGGSGYDDSNWPYNNSFLIADAQEAWELETSSRYWCARKVKSVASLSNHLVIADDWDRLGNEVAEHAAAEGWWDPRVEKRLNFALAYRDLDSVPSQVSAARHSRTCRFLAETNGRISLASLRSLLRDHYDAGEVYKPGRTPAEPEYFTLCMHADPVGTTTASIIVEQPSLPELRSCWACFGNPCTGIFLPYYIFGSIPPEAGAGGKEPSTDSPWWRFKQLLSMVERDFARNGPIVRQLWNSLENQILQETANVEKRASTMIQAGEHQQAAALLTKFMADNLRTTLQELAEITAQIA